jgi:Sulfotransferase family
MEDVTGAPIVIGGFGGSGTRVVARIVKQAGYYMGTNLNESEDAMEFVEFYDRWINRYLLRWLVPFYNEENDLMDSDFRSCVSRHRREIAAEDARWGWKNPRSIHVLPFIHGQLPNLKFIQVVRDGRDIAFSTNDVQLRRHGSALLDPILLNAPPPIRTASLWARINMEAASYGEAQLARQYLILKFERLCQTPHQAVKEIFDFLGTNHDNVAVAAHEVVTPSSIGRWQHGDGEILKGIYAHAGEALRKFGYC